MSALRASREAARYRAQLRRAESYIAELNTFAVRVLLDGRLADPDDFHAFIGMDAVTTAEGRLDFREFELQVEDLVRRKPHLSASRGSLGEPDREAPAASDPSTSPPAEDAHQASGPRAISHPQEES
ncbi:MAG: hypothetical protein KQH57_17295 [Actinomycetales bacterium]|nr:hypothetical protein [Actinomycetales bacterium]